jgi:tRNA pseudouridine32 synthase / 23S rRNA pseudouridine746 synthase
MRHDIPITDWAAIRDSCVLFEDEATLVLDKPAGISVVDDRQETSLVALARDAGEQLLPAHRIDKVTSGAVVFAKDPRIHASLARQFNRRSIEKAYLAIVRSNGLPAFGTIDLPLSKGRKNRVRVACLRRDIVTDHDGNHWSVAPSGIFADVKIYPSVTRFARLHETDHDAIIVVRPITGRQHQIRVHLAWIGHPVTGDPLYAGARGDTPERAYLHAWRVAFDADWVSGSTRIVVEAVPEDVFWQPVRGILPDIRSETVIERARLALVTLDSMS